MKDLSVLECTIKYHYKELIIMKIKSTTQFQQKPGVVKRSALESLEEFSKLNLGKKGLKDVGANMNDYLYGKKSDYASK